MKKGDSVKYANVDDTTNYLVVTKIDSGLYQIELENGTDTITQNIESSAIVRHIIKTAEDIGYRRV